MYFYSIPFTAALKKSLAVTIGITFLSLSLFVFLEPSISNAATDNVVVTQVVTGAISISNGSDITMTALDSSGQDSAVGNTSWTITTNNATGYTLSVKASSAPALTDGGSNSFADYATSSPTTWSVPSGKYEFGFSGFGDEVASTFEPTTQTDCDPTADTPNASLKWSGFKTTDIQLASKSSPSDVSGDTETLCVATEQNGVFAPAATYTATITATAVTQ